MPLTMGSSRPISQASDIVFRLPEPPGPFVEGLTSDAEVLGSESGISFSRGIVEDHPLHSQPLLGGKTRKVRHSPPALISILQDNKLSFKEGRS